MIIKAFIRIARNPGYEVGQVLITTIIPANHNLHIGRSIHKDRALDDSQVRFISAHIVRWNDNNPHTVGREIDFIKMNIPHRRPCRI